MRQQFSRYWQIARPFPTLCVSDKLEGAVWLSLLAKLAPFYVMATDRGWLS